MELMTKEIQMNKSGGKVLNQFLLDEDYNVPDSKRDMQRIIACEGKVQIEDAMLVENYVRVKGRIEFQVLYAGDGLEPMLCALEGKLPFEEMVYVEDTSWEFSVSNARVDLRTIMIHSRKIRVKAMIELELSAGKTVLEELSLDMESQVPLYKKKKEFPLLKLYLSKRDTYRIKEEITLPGTKETIGNILWCDISNRKLDTKLDSDGLQLMGELLIFCFYESPDGKIDWIEQAVPYQGRVDCMGADSAMYHQAAANLEEVHAEPRLDEDGEMRILGIDGTLRVEAAVYEEESLALLKDVYSLEKQCRPQQKEVELEQLILQNHSKCKVTERLSLPELKQDILQICHSNATVQLDHTEMTEQGVLVEGALHISFLYVKANDEIPFDTWQGVVPFSYLVECKDMSENMKCHISSILEQLSVSLLGGDGAEIKAVLAFHCFFRREIKETFVSDMILEEINLEELAKRPGVVGYIVKDGDELWDLAKRYNTTIDGIMEVNEMKDDRLKPGERILIFKENMSIL